MNIETKKFEFHYHPVDDIKPLDLIDNATLALHHHMAPAHTESELKENKK